MTLFDSLRHYSNIRWHFVHCDQMDKASLETLDSEKVAKRFCFRRNRSSSQALACSLAKVSVPIGQKFMLKE